MNLSAWQTSVIRSLVMVILVGAGLSRQGAPSRTAAAPPVAVTPPKPAAKFVERPALPFLTLMLIRDPAVHDELQLTATQIDKVRADIATVDEDLWRLRDVPLEKAGAPSTMLLGKLRDLLKRDLKKSQMERFDQIVLQSRGAKSLVSPEIVQRLKLSNGQVDKIHKLLAEAAEKPAAADGDDQRGPRKEQGTAQPTDVLNARQRKELSTLLGKTFDISQLQQIGGMAPELRGVEAWINSDPLTLKGLRGKVVVVHFWAFGCINCIRNLPHYQLWYDKFPRDELTIIGLQTPETENERSLEKLRNNVRERGIAYPVAFDLKSENWKAWGNDMWPSVYLIDKKGQVRNWWYGELNWQGGKGEEFFRQRIELLLAEPD